MPRRLHEDLKSDRPFDLLEEEAHLSISLTAARLEHAAAQMLKAYLLTPTQYNVLRILRGAGPAGLCRNEIGSRLIRAVPDVTRLLDRMTDQKLIGRQRTDEDRRFVRTYITPRGLDLVNRLDEPLRAFHRKRLAAMDPARLRTLVDILAEIREAGA